MAKPQLPAGFCPSSASLWPRTFPMKLWLLVNSPCVHSVRWDARGEGLFIDQGLFEQELLGVGPSAAGEVKLFRTKNYGSIVRQLNLYGFHKLTVSLAGSTVGSRPRPATAGEDTSYADGPLHHFWNPHFCYGCPDLLVKIKRLTKADKKLDAGLEVTSRLPDDLQSITGRRHAAVAHVPRRAVGNHIQHREERKGERKTLRSTVGTHKLSNFQCSQIQEKKVHRKVSYYLNKMLLDAMC